MMLGEKHRPTWIGNVQHIEHVAVQHERPPTSDREGPRNDPRWEYASSAGMGRIGDVDDEQSSCAHEAAAVQHVHEVALDCDLVDKLDAASRTRACAA
jgi:hypothetical protein